MKTHVLCLGIFFLSFFRLSFVHYTIIARRAAATIDWLVVLNPNLIEYKKR